MFYQSDETIRHLMAGNYVIISGNANLYPAEVEEPSTFNLYREVHEIVQDKPNNYPMIAEGFYAGETEGCVIAPGLTRGQGFDLAIKYGQESYIYVDRDLIAHLIYVLGDNAGKFYRTTEFTLSTIKPKDDYTAIQTVGKPIYFQLHF